MTLYYELCQPQRSDLTFGRYIGAGTALHGLFEDAQTTWTDSKTGILWLQDLFPSTELRARVLLYQYDAGDLTSNSAASGDRILPYASTFLAHLEADRSLRNAAERPLVFVCHGFGGILLKRALIMANASRDPKVYHRRAVFVSTYAILFLATPHYGIEKEAILMRCDALNVTPSQFMLNVMSGSEMLQDVNDQFAPLSRGIQMYYFWEQQRTSYGKLATFIVSEQSAAPAWDDVDRCGIQADHSAMVKFSNARDPGYRVVLGALSRYCRAAPEPIKMRWSHDREVFTNEIRMEAEEMLQPLMKISSPKPTNSRNTNEWFLVPRAPINYFTGRQLHAQTVTDSLGPTSKQTERHQHKIFVIYGLGGSGKTQFCLKYVQDHRLMYWGVFWIDASSDENAQAGFATIGQQVGKSANFAAGIHWLGTRSESWLLVLDNADDTDMDMSQYIPAGGNGHILITTKNPSLTELATAGQLRFRGMDPEEAITLLLKAAYPPDKLSSLQPHSRTVAQGIAAELGYLAVALHHAGFTIRKNIYTLEKYLRHYLGHRRSMLSSPMVKSADYANVVTTWEIPFQRIQQRSSAPHQDAVELLYTFAFLHFNSIPIAVLQRCWDDMQYAKFSEVGYPRLLLENTPLWNEDRRVHLQEALAILNDHSIVDYDVDHGSCSLHPIIQEWARERLSSEERKCWSNCASAILAHGVSSHQHASERKFRRLLLPHVDSCLRALRSQFTNFPVTAEQATVIERFASLYAENGLWTEARALQQQTVEFRSLALGANHRSTLSAQRKLSFILWNLFDVKPLVKIQMDIRKSELIFRPTLVSYLHWPPWSSSHLSYCDILSDLTSSLWLAGEHQWSERAGEKALQGLTKSIGVEDPRTLDAMFNLARTYLHLGKLSKSREMLLWVLKGRRTFFGPHHPETLMAKNELGMCYHAQKRMAVAERLVRNVLQARKRILGEEHAYTLWSVNDLSKVVCDRGHPLEAAEMLEEIVPVVIRTLGTDHVGMTMTRSNLARAYVRSKRWRDAHMLLSDLTGCISPDHPDWINAMWGLGYVRIELGFLDEAEADSKRILDRLLKKNAQANQWQQLAFAQQLLRIYRLQKRDSEIELLFRQAPALSGTLGETTTSPTELYPVGSSVHAERPDPSSDALGPATIRQPHVGPVQELGYSEEGDATSRFPRLRGSKTF